jgi:hypothetical protein
MTSPTPLPFITLTLFLPDLLGYVSAFSAAQVLREGAKAF